MHLIWQQKRGGPKSQEQEKEEFYSIIDESIELGAGPQPPDVEPYWPKISVRPQLGPGCESEVSSDDTDDEEEWQRNNKGGKSKGKGKGKGGNYNNQWSPPPQPQYPYQQHQHYQHHAWQGQQHHHHQLQHQQQWVPRQQQGLMPFPHQQHQHQHHAQYAQFQHQHQHHHMQHHGHQHLHGGQYHDHYLLHQQKHQHQLALQQHQHQMEQQQHQQQVEQQREQHYPVSIAHEAMLSQASARDIQRDSTSFSSYHRDPASLTSLGAPPGLFVSPGGPRPVPTLEAFSAAAAAGDFSAASKEELFPSLAEAYSPKEKQDTVQPPMSSSAAVQPAASSSIEPPQPPSQPPPPPPVHAEPNPSLLHGWSVGEEQAQSSTALPFIASLGNFNKADPMYHTRIDVSPDLSPDRGLRASGAPSSSLGTRLKISAHPDAVVEQHFGPHSPLRRPSQQSPYEMQHSGDPPLPGHDSFRHHKSFDPSASSFQLSEGIHHYQYEEPPPLRQDFSHPIRQNVNANFGLDADAPEFQPGQYKQQQPPPQQEQSSSSFTAGAAEFYPMGHPNDPSNRQ